MAVLPGPSRILDRRCWYVVSSALSFASLTSIVSMRPSTWARGQHAGIRKPGRDMTCIRDGAAEGRLGASALCAEQAIHRGQRWHREAGGRGDGYAVGAEAAARVSGGRRLEWRRCWRAAATWWTGCWKARDQMRGAAGVVARGSWATTLGACWHWRLGSAWTAGGVWAGAGADLDQRGTPLSPTTTRPPANLTLTLPGRAARHAAAPAACRALPTQTRFWTLGSALCLVTGCQPESVTLQTALLRQPRPLPTRPQPAAPAPAHPVNPTVPISAQASPGCACEPRARAAHPAPPVASHHCTADVDTPISAPDTRPLASRCSPSARLPLLTALSHATTTKQLPNAPITVSRRQHVLALWRLRQYLHPRLHLG